MKKNKYTIYRNRVLSTMRRLRNKGLDFDNLFFPTEKQIRASGVKGVELTKLTLQLKKLTSKELIKLATYKPKDEVIVEPVKSTNEDFYSSNLIENFIRQVLHYPKGFVQYVTSWIRLSREKYGDKAVADMLQDGFKSGIEFSWATMYKKDELEKFISDMLNFLPDIGLLEKENIMDDIEEDAYYNSQAGKRYRR